MVRKGKTLILLIILSVIGSLVLSGFAIQHAAKSAEEEARKELGAAVTLQVDRQKQMQERQGSGERGRPEQQAISLEEIESIAKLSKVKSVNYVSQTTASSVATQTGFGGPGWSGTTTVEQYPANHGDNNGN